MTSATGVRANELRSSRVPAQPLRALTPIAAPQPKPSRGAALATPHLHRRMRFALHSSTGEEARWLA